MRAPALTERLQRPAYGRHWLAVSHQGLGRSVTFILRFEVVTGTNGRTSYPVLVTASVCPTGRIGLNLVTTVQPRRATLRGVCQR